VRFNATVRTEVIVAILSDEIVVLPLCPRGGVAVSRDGQYHNTTRTAEAELCGIKCDHVILLQGRTALSRACEALSSLASRRVLRAEVLERHRAIEAEDGTEPAPPS